MKSLAQTVKAKNEAAYRTAFTAWRSGLAAADKGVRAKEQNWPALAVDTVLELLRTAANEYEEAVEDGRIAEAVEYQDSRGFVWQAERLFDERRRRAQAKERRGAQSRKGRLRRAEKGVAGPRSRRRSP